MPKEIIANLTLEYFKIGNAVTAFYVVQTLIFLNTIYKEQKLLEILIKNKKLSIFVTCVIAFIYSIVIIGCGVFEKSLLQSINETDLQIIISNIDTAIISRCSIIVVLASFCAWVIHVLKKN